MVTGRQWPSLNGLWCVRGAGVGARGNRGHTLPSNTQPSFFIFDLTWAKKNGFEIKKMNISSVKPRSNPQLYNLGLITHFIRKRHHSQSSRKSPLINMAIRIKFNWYIIKYKSQNTLGVARIRQGSDRLPTKYASLLFLYGRHKPSESRGCNANAVCNACAASCLSVALFPGCLLPSRVQ